MIPRGQLKHVVTIETLTEVDDGHGGLIDSWAVVQSRKAARVRPLQGRELEVAKQVNARISHEVALRYWRGYHADLDGGRARVVYHERIDRTFDVVAPPIDVGELHEDVLLMCAEEQ